MCVCKEDTKIKKCHINVVNNKYQNNNVTHTLHVLSATLIIAVLVTLD